MDVLRAAGITVYDTQDRRSQGSRWIKSRRAAAGVGAAVVLAVGVSGGVEPQSNWEDWSSNREAEVSTANVIQVLIDWIEGWFPDPDPDPAPEPEPDDGW